MDILPVKLLDKAIKAVPPLRYALGVVGLVAVIAIVKILQVEFAIAVFGAIVVVALMILLVVFSTLAESKNKKSLRSMGLVLAWVVMILIVLILVLLVVEYFAHWPFNIFAPASITVSGVVYDENKAPVAGAEITDDGSREFTRSRSDGSYLLKFPNAKKGTGVSFLVFREGFVAAQVGLTAGESANTKDIILKKAKTPVP
jgi:4-amino-4-deoxy-L-arabinose transferase-like glycosyltransferase